MTQCLQDDGQKCRLLKKGLIQLTIVLQCDVTEQQNINELVTYERNCLQCQYFS